MFILSDTNCPIEQFIIVDKTALGDGLLKAGCLSNHNISNDCRTIIFSTHEARITGEIPS